ncbi:MAG: penicillin-binding protein activator [Deltaproteobacteria bacterium]|nr:penicillin-binding protein activator [Deltaproteobacteria bacterium]
MKRLAYLLPLLFLLPACPKRVVVVDGVEVPYEEAAGRAYASAMQKVEQKGGAEGIEALRDYIEHYPEADETDAAYFHLARLYREGGDDAAARGALSTLLERHPFSDFTATAQLMLGEMHLEAEQYNDAMQILKPAYKKLDGAGQQRAARALSEAAVGVQDWQGAVAWLAELKKHARDDAEKERIDAMLLDLVDGKLPAVGLAQLRADLDEDSPVMPMVVMKLALVQVHLRDYRRAYELLGIYLREHPEGPHAERARALSSRIEKLAQVSPLTVGLVLPLSGTYKPFGEDVLKGIGMALDVEVEGEKGKKKDQKKGEAAPRKSPVRLVIRDSKGDPDEAARQIEALVMEERAVAVIGPLLQSTAVSAAVKAEELGLPLIALSRAEGLTELGSWIFRNAVTDQAQARGLVEFAADQLGARTFGILWPKKPYGEALARHFWDAVEARGLEVRAAEIYEHDQTTFKEPIKRMVGRYYLSYREEYRREKDKIEWTVKDEYKKRKALEALRDGLEPVADFDVLFVPDDYKTIGLIAPALAAEDIITNVCDARDLERIKKTVDKKELPLVRLMGPNAWNNQALVERGGKYVHCSVLIDGFFSDSKRLETRNFVDAYQRTYETEKKPGYLVAHGYDTARIVRQIIEGASPQTRAAFRETLLSVKAFPGATGDIDVRASGELEKRLFILTVDRDGIHEWEAEGAAGDVPAEADKKAK